MSYKAERGLKSFQSQQSLIQHLENRTFVKSHISVITKIVYQLRYIRI